MNVSGMQIGNGEPREKAKKEKKNVVSAVAKIQILGHDHATHSYS